MARDTLEWNGRVSEDPRAPVCPDHVRPPSARSAASGALLPPWAIAPRYDGYGIAAIPNTILQHFGLEPRLPPLATELLPPDLLRGARTILLILLDALGYDQLVRGLESGACPNLRALLRHDGAHLAALTSIFPSTTAAALTTFATGEPPIRHGMAGYTLWLEEAGSVVEMIRLAPWRRDAPAPDPASFLPVPTIFQRLGAAGVTCDYVNLKRLLGSGLSVMHGKGAQLHPAITFADLCCTVRRLLDKRRGRPQLIQAYWDAIDGIAHLRGPRTEEHDAELATIDFILGRELLDRVEREDVLLLIAADHGHCETSPQRAVWLDQQPELLALLAHPPAGERRAPYLYPRPGKAMAVRDWFRRRAADTAVLLERDEVLEDRLWGPPPFAPAALRRIGEQVVLPAPGWQFPYHRGDNDITQDLPIGAHGNLTRQETLVPLLASRLG